MDETVKELGCLIFKLFQRREIADRFILWEVFKDKEAFDSHM
ncbi:putative quinol monooxygenase [Bartonella sp. HY761]